MAKQPKENINKLRALNAKWGKDVVSVRGWTAVPNILLERQQSLKLDSVKLNILLVLLKHWWEKTNMPYPSKVTIGEIIGKDPSTVQRHIRSMENQGLLSRSSRFHSAGGQTSNMYDLTGLLKILDILAKQELKEQKQQKDKEGRKRRGRVEKS